MPRYFGAILPLELPPSLQGVLANYLFYVEEQPFLLSRSVEHVGNFVELDTLKNDNTGDSRKTLVPCNSIVAIVDMTEERQTLGFLAEAD